MAELFDLDRAARTRASMLTDLPAGMPQDIAEALSGPGVPDYLLSRGFEVVDDIGALQGPASGPVVVPTELHYGGLAPEVLVDDTEDCALLYQNVLAEGTVDAQQQVLNEARLTALWPSLSLMLPAAIAQVWQRRFPVLSAD
ncbi:hypothetical protein ABZW18_00185 [Streptomyces sp. NPDC004647]|uniref:hypothetical protein n=1 Tax=Streptomyces sp. NPDC004647 TaxID=3154671 RepID=UPI0033AB36AC